MSRIAEKVKSNVRTGQLGAMVPAQGSGYYSGRTNGYNGNGNGAPCGPAMPTQPQSWGAACPTGNCTADMLASNLGRAFAGERYPCREIPYWTRVTASAAGIATFDGNSKVTICPTRVIIHPNAAATVDVQLSRFEIGNQNQVVGDPIPVPFLNVQSYVIIPFVTDCLKAGIPFGFTIIGAASGAVFDFGIIGPAIG